MFVDSVYNEAIQTHFQARDLVKIYIYTHSQRQQAAEGVL